MSEQVVLNPVQSGWDPIIMDNMNPNYGFTRKRPVTRLNKKAVGGVPYSRELQNTGHSFTFSWISRSWLCVQRLKWFYEQFEDGYFTIIDWDGGGRHYVGHFTSEVSPVPTSNGRWDVQGVTFEEIPTVPMKQYPSDWDHDSITVNVSNDYGDQKVALSGAWTVNAQAMLDGNGNETSYQTADDPGTAGDWAQYEYRGYGFRLYLRKGPAFGQCNLVVDGVQQANLIDCYAAANFGPSLVQETLALPLDYHRVQVLCSGNKNANASAAAISWVRMQVMR
jgi:hypothetical protein